MHDDNGADGRQACAEQGKKANKIGLQKEGQNMLQATNGIYGQTDSRDGDETDPGPGLLYQIGRGIHQSPADGNQQIDIAPVILCTGMANMTTPNQPTWVRPRTREERRAPLAPKDVCTNGRWSAY